MPRPKTKEELLALSQENFINLNQYIDSFNPDEQLKDFASGTMNRNIRDVVAHLYHWHLMLMDWYAVGMTGAKPDIPSKGYSWKTTPELNHWIWNNYQNTDLEKARKMFQDSHRQVTALIEKHSNQELFEKKRYPWTGTTSLGAYFISATSSHYEWALKLIKKGKK